MLTNAKREVLALFSKCNPLGPPLWEYVSSMVLTADKNAQQPADIKKVTGVLQVFCILEYI